MTSKKLAIVLLSGGLDSTTTAAIAKDELGENSNYCLTAVSFDYGQRHRRELDSAKRVADKLGIVHMEVNLRALKSMAFMSALTSHRAIDVPMGRSVSEMGVGVPVTYVPMRNTVLLSLAASMLESLCLDEIENGKYEVERAFIYIGANVLDYSGYPDCRPEYYDTLAATFSMGSSLATEYGVPFEIKTPLIKLTKAEIIQRGLAFGAPLHLTWSCYMGGETPCGECDSCILRAKGFEEAGIARREYGA